MKYEYEIIHKFRTETKQERSDNLYRLLAEYRNHRSALNPENEEGMEDVDGSSVH